MHTEEQPGIYQWCGKAFARKCDVEAYGRDCNEESPYCVLFYKDVFSQVLDISSNARIQTGQNPETEDRERHMRCHSVERLYKCEACDAAYARNDDIMSPSRRNTEETSNRLPRWKSKHQASVSHQKSSVICEENRSVDEKKLPFLEGHLTVYPNIDTFFLRTYGCGLCDETFNIDKEFMDHCRNHFCYTERYI